MNLDEVKNILVEKWYAINNEDRLPNNHGTQLRLESGPIINVFDTGKINVQGKNKDELEDLLKKGNSHTSYIQSKPFINTKVFVVYGHNTSARDQIEVMLHRWGLEPLILDRLPSEGQTIIEKLEKYTGQVGFAVVLATPDDEGHRAGHPDEKSFRARQNVVLELGMLLSALGRKKVAILLNQQVRMDRPSDIQGLIYIPF